MKYENRFVLFLDILGFKKIVESTYDKELDITESIIELHEALKTITKSLGSINGSKRVTQFSDSIVVSFLGEDIKEFEYLLDDISYMLYLLASQKIICRGAISHGKFYHDNDYLFGPALVEAYETESKAAIYPRVILDKSVIEIANQFRKGKERRNSFRREYVNLYLQEDLDDKLYIDYFYNPIRFVDGGILTYINYLVKLRDIISDGASKARTPDVKIKYGWMKQKFNNVLIRLSKENKIHILKNDQLVIKPFK